MKKLTKTLSLVLVVAMVLGLCVIGAGATFTDNDKITKDYSEAVEIMTDLKVVGGMPNGSFQPAGTLTRAQAAVILTNITVGASASAVAPNTQTFKDVPTSFWGYKYIEYAAQAGLVAGTGNGKYSPNATLTGYQWALMLMKVLGITVDTGANWQINTAKVYYAADTSFSDVAISNAAMTREAATQMAYDALFYSSNAKTGYAVYKNGVAIAYYDSINEASAQAALFDSLDATAAVYTFSTAPVTIASGTSLAKTVFGVTKTSGTDDFSRSATTYAASTTAYGKAYGWTNSAKSFVTKPAAEYTTAVTGAKIFADLGLTKPVTTETTVTDGVSGTTSAVTYNNTSAVAGTGNGVLTQVYYDSATNTVKIVEINTYFGVVSTVAAATTVAPATVNVVPSSYVKLSTFVGGSVAASGLKVGDYVTYTVAQTAVNTFKVESVAAAAIKTLTATGYVAGTSFNAAGTTYQYNVKGNGTIADYTTAHDVYFDSYGYAIAVMGATSTANYAVVLAAATNSSSLDGISYSARLLMNDGKTVDVAIDSASYTLVNSTMASKQQIVSWTKNASTSIYTLLDAVVAAPYASKTVSVTTGVPTFTVDGTPYYANDNTVFLTRNGDGITSAYTYAEYTGISKVPSLSGTVNADVLVGSNGYAAVVYVDGATAVTNTATGKVYLTGTYSEAYDAVKGHYYTANAIIDGQPTTVDLSGAPVAGIYSAISYNANKVGTVVDGVTEVDAVGITTLTYGIVKIGNVSLVPSADCTVYYISAVTGTNPTTGVGSVSSVAGIVTDGTDTVKYTKNAAGQVNTIYIQKVTETDAALAAANNVKATIAGTAYTVTATVGSEAGTVLAPKVVAAVTVTPTAATDTLALTLVPNSAGAIVTVVTSNLPAVCTAGSTYSVTYAVTSENGAATVYYSVAVTVAPAGSVGIALT